MTSVDSNISFPFGDKALSGYLARPDGERPFPAVVVIHEANGITDNIRNVTQRLAEKGYIAFAIAWACADSRLKAIAPYYAMNPRTLAPVARLCPVVGSYPADDFTAQAGWKLDIELNKYQIPDDIAVYPGAEYSFFNEQGRNYNAAAAQDSWRRALAFFKERLG